MPFFHKSKSIPNLHRKASVPWDVLEECLKLEGLIEDMRLEYIYMMRPYQHFRRPTPLTLYEVLADLKVTE
jgi:hypothetical protein